MGVNATDTSKVTIFNAGIYGNASQFLQASDLSHVTVVGTVTVGRELRFEVAFLTARSNSVVSFSPSKLIGGEAMLGASYQCNDAIIRTNVTLPGGDVPFAGTENCIFNATFSNPETKAIRTEIDTQVKPEIKAIRTETDTQVKPEIKAIRTEIDTQVKLEIKAIYKLLRNTIIAVLAVLTVAAMVSAFYVWNQHRRRRLLCK